MVAFEYAFGFAGVFFCVDLRVLGFLSTFYRDISRRSKAAKPKQSHYPLYLSLVFGDLKHFPGSSLDS